METSPAFKVDIFILRLLISDELRFLISEKILGFIGFFLIFTINFSLNFSDTGGSFKVISFSDYNLLI